MCLQKKYHLHFIHGFLGLPADWEYFKPYFFPHVCSFHSIEKYLSPLHSNDAFKAWTENFNAAVFSNDMNHSTQHILIGYSLGGRLALHALLNAPTKWHAAIIISAHPGLLTPEEKQARVLQDTKWTQRFLNDDWDTLMTDWNTQGVFAKQNNTLDRDEKNFSRNCLATQLNDLSLGKQENLREKIASLNLPLLWMAGALDTKFTAIAHEMTHVNKNISSINFLNTGHRVPWESPHEFIKQCNLFLEHFNAC